MNLACRLCGALLLIVGLGACTPAAYYWQAAKGQLELRQATRPVPDVIGDPATTESLRSKLRLAERMREFASRELALPDNASYRGYAALNRPFVVWNVVAAPEFSLKPLEWCFPVAGCVQYRGYFAEAGAQEYARTLAGAGRDIHVGGVPAYSTLGWFADPLLSTFIHYPESELARLVFHELAHQVVYVKDDSVFNESFAVAVENEGVRRWLVAEGSADEQARFARHQERRRDFAALVDAAQAQLEALYATGPEALDDTARRARKQAIFTSLRADFDALRARWGGHPVFERWMPRQPNNAWLAARNTYARQVPPFEAILDGCKADMRCFFGKVKELAGLPRDERDQRLSAFNVLPSTHADVR